MITDQPIVDAINELEKLRSERQDHWQVPLEEGYLLHHIALSIRARYIVEIGTSYGFSGLFWGDALKRTGGTLHTIDIDPRKYESARLTFAKAGLNGIITNHLGDAAQIVPALPGDIDLAFIDADKASTGKYFDLLWPRLRSGGSLLIDNATTHREELAEIVRHIRGRGDASSTEVAVGNGIEWAIKA